MRFCAFFSKGQKTAYAAAEGASDITQSGVDFINAAPEETTVYKAGEGSVTYIPAQTDGTAEIVLENAEIHSGTKVNYKPQLGRMRQSRRRENCETHSERRQSRVSSQVIAQQPLAVLRFERSRFRRRHAYDRPRECV